MGTIPDDMSRHLRPSARGRADHAAGRRHRLRLLDAAAQGRAGEGRRRRRLGPALLHGCVGRDVPHHHERGLSPRRDDGDACAATIPTSRPSSRPSASRAGCACSISRCWSPTPSCRRCKEDAPWELSFGGTDLQDAAGARALGQDHARDLRLCRAGRDLHRPHQPAQQSLIIARPSAPPIPAASSRCRPMAPASWARSISRRWCAIPSRRGAARHGASSTRLVPLAVRMLDNVDRRLALPAAEQQAQEAQGQAPHRPRRHRPCRRAHPVRRALRLGRGGAR